MREDRIRAQIDGMQQLPAHRKTHPMRMRARLPGAIGAATGMYDQVRLPNWTTGVAIDPPNGDASAGVIGHGQHAPVRTKGGMARIGTERGEVSQRLQASVVNANPALFLFVE